MPSLSDAPINGSVSLGVYLINYDEDQWNRYDAEDQEFCKQQWLKKATPTAAKFIALRLIPDAMFPSREHEFPYIAWQQELVKGPVRPWSIDAKAVATLQPNMTDLEVVAACVDIERHIRSSYPAGTLWEIYRPSILGEEAGGYTIKRGRV